ncbi:hypothetical protein STSR3_74 [Salmonella virus STSR3]|nr:hypothetical protein STSR3_74 [Salmonella virus STSR3]
MRKEDAVTAGIWTAQELHKIKSIAYEKSIRRAPHCESFQLTSFLIPIKLLNTVYSIKLVWLRLSQTIPTTCRLLTRFCLLSLVKCSAWVMLSGSPLTRSRLALELVNRCLLAKLTPRNWHTISL